MKFLAIYRASFYLMLSFATLVLSVDATDDSPVAMLYPAMVAAASILAYLTVDRNPALAPSRTVAGLLGIGAGLLSYAEYHYDPSLMLLAAGHWLVYLQLIKMFLPKTVEDDWFLFLLGLVQVLVGGVMSQSDKVGIALFGWTVSSLWVLTLFALQREAIRLKAVPMAFSARSGDRGEPYRGLINGAFVLATSRVALLTLALGGLIFLAMPRFSSMGNSRSNGAVAKHLSGFDDEVQLGQLGEILENDSVVMSVELSDREGRRIPHDPAAEYRWRGVSLDSYEKGRWRRPKLLPSGYAWGLAESNREARLIRQTIKLEPTESPILFSIRPILAANSVDRPYQPDLNEIDGTLFRMNTASVTVDYVADSSNRPDQAQPGEAYPGPGYAAKLLAMDDDLRARLRAIAEEQVRGISEADTRARAEALADYLRGSGRFQYTLKLDVVDPEIDPVLDFLVNRKAGHCEFFASALTLMLRSIEIPARMVNGFKGGDYNTMSGATTVRQKHAHSWVEVLIGVSSGPGTENLPIWLTLDPTPANQRNQSVAQVGGLATNFRQLTDLVRYIWIFYIVGFNAERQDRFLYAPIRALIAEARRGFEIMGRAIREVLHFPSVESFFSLRGFVVSFVALLVLVGLARLATWLGGKALRRYRGQQAEHTSTAAAIQFYRRLLALLAEYGLERPPAETPREFARRAAVFLARHGSGSEAVADVPPLVVDAFYKIRFGEQTLGDDDFTHVNARLDALQSRLHPEKT